MARLPGIVHVVAGEQDLPHGLAVLAEKFIVQVHQLTLTHGGHGLLLPQGHGPLLHAQAAGADADGAGADQNDLMSRVPQVGQGPGQTVQTSEIGAPPLMGQGGRADLHDDTPAAGL